MENTKTNIEVVSDLMEFGKTGLEQPFIIEAIARYANEVSSMTEKQAAKFQKQTTLINVGQWIYTAKYIKTQLDEKYNIKG